MLNRILLILILVMAVGGVSGYAQSDDDNHLLDMLGFVPDTPEMRAEELTLNYLDFAANQTALNTDLYTLYAVTGDFWFDGLNRVPWVGREYFVPQLDLMQETVGFGWGDVDRLLEARTPGDPLTVYAGDFDRAAIDTALNARQFETEERGGISVWHRFEDDTTNVESADSVDPFGGHIGSAARLADYDGQLVYARNWEMLESAVAAHAGNAPSLADADDFRALAEAVSVDGDLIRVLILLEGLTARLGDADEVAAGLETLPEDWNIALDGWGTLPPPLFAALVDQQQGSDQVNSIALVYADAQTAEAAATEMDNAPAKL